MMFLIEPSIKEQYDKNGILKYRERFIIDPVTNEEIVHGVTETLYEDGNYKSREHFYLNSAQGLSQYYYDNGLLALNYYYYCEQRYGLQQEWNPQGKLAEYYMLDNYVLSRDQWLFYINQMNLLIKRYILPRSPVNCSKDNIVLLIEEYID